MKLILIKDVEKLGSAGDAIEVKKGYGRNFLIPKGLAKPFGQKDVKFLENEKKKLQIKQKRLKEKAEELKEKLSNISCTIAMSAGEDDKIHGEVTPEMISDFYTQEGIEIDKRKIQLEKPIRNLGVYRADVKLHPDVTTNLKIWVVKK